MTLAPNFREFAAGSFSVWGANAELVIRTDSLCIPKPEGCALWACFELPPMTAYVVSAGEQSALQKRHNSVQ